MNSTGAASPTVATRVDDITRKAQAETGPHQDAGRRPNQTERGLTDETAQLQ